MTPELLYNTRAASRFTPAFSPESRAIVRTHQEFLRDRGRTITLGWKITLRDRVFEILQECNTDGWDGYDALPISRASAGYALRLIDALPDNIEIPDVDPEPTGLIGFGWHPKRDLLLSVAASSGQISYAAILGPQCNRHGDEPFYDALPETLEDILLRYFVAAR